MIGVSALGTVFLDLWKIRKNLRGEQKEVVTYKFLEERVEIGLTKRVGEHLEVDVQVQVERECGEAETNVSQDSEIRSKD